MREYDPSLEAWVERPWEPHEHRWIYAGGRIEEGNEWCQCGEMRKAGEPQRVERWPADPDLQAWAAQRGADWITGDQAQAAFRAKAHEILAADERRIDWRVVGVLVGYGLLCVLVILLALYVGGVL